MAKKRRTEIVVERERVIVLSRSTSNGATWCRRCATRVWTVTPAEAAVMSGVPLETIEHWIAADALHLEAVTNGELRICVNSLLFIQ